MNKSELIDAMADQAGLTKTDTKKALDAFISATSGALKGGERVALVGFGSFSVTVRNARTGIVISLPVCGFLPVL
ncbi:MAG: HU family DNA-binding protein, partial [Bacteroidota bacterium]|nr:HU family DNA-binding protein [Bacteroidota bacterium]